MMHYNWKYNFGISALFFLVSCNQVKEKTTDFNESITEEVDYQINKTFPKFDNDQADTKNNKQRFKDFLKVEITPDVKNIYCHDDPIGIDADYMFAFNCNKNTAQKIIEKHQLELDTTNFDNGFGMQDDFHWWNKDRISELPKYCWNDGDQYYKYYWYDTDSSKAYFFDFDL